MMLRATHIVLLVSLWLPTGMTKVAIYDIHVGDLYRMQKGIGWPDTLNVMVGNEGLIKLSSSFQSQNCEVTTPTGEVFDVLNPPNNRYERWSDGCGLRVKNIDLSDSGRWRLTAVRGNDSVTGWTEVHVQENIDRYTPAPITLHDGQTAKVELSTLTNSYCVVAQPFSGSSLVPGHCSVTLDRTTRAVQGNWHVLLGLPGRVAELPVDRSVTVESERLDIGFLHETNPQKLHLYCNILHSEKNITFCRFQRTSTSVGYNVMDGLSDGTYSYYGEGFAKRHCGITIEKPNAADYATWRCTVGLQEWNGANIEQRAPLQALIRPSTSSSIKTRAQKQTRQKDSKELRTVFVQRDMSFTISCQAEASLSYCWFQNPNGSQFTPITKADDEQMFWYSGESLQMGDCSITFSHASDDQSGEWTCHMGPKDVKGVEITDKVRVRVTGPLAAREKQITATVGEKATLYCHTSNGNRPLDYCRFLTPNFLGISIDSTVTAEDPVLDRFYFTPNRDLNYGDCSLTIDPVLAEDLGEWTCAALVDEETLESRDTISVLVQEVYTFQAGVIGLSVGLSVLVLTLAGLGVYKYRGKIEWRSTRNPQRTDVMSLEEFQSEVDSVRRSSVSRNSSSSVKA